MVAYSSVAEWAIARLQIEGSEIKPEPGTSETAGTLHGAYTCSSMSHSGRLVLTSEGVQFEPFVASHNQWKIAYNRINRVEKVSVPSTLQIQHPGRVRILTVMSL